MSKTIIDGDAGPTFLFAHGAGSPMDSDFMNAVAAGVAQAGYRVVRFEFPYMQERRQTGKRRPPNRMPQLEDAFRAAYAEAVDEFGADVFVGGKSMGGRVASRLADELGALGVACFGYPFHPPRKPEKLRTAHLESLQTPMIVLQGTRDKFGTPDEVADYDLAEGIEVHWIEDGDHSLVPRKRSGRTPEQNLDEAIEAAVTFMNART